MQGLMDMVHISGLNPETQQYATQMVIDMMSQKTTTTVSQNTSDLPQEITPEGKEPLFIL